MASRARTSRVSRSRSSMGTATRSWRPEGHEQAALVADRLIASGERIAAIYVTTLRRTHETAAPLAARLGIEPQVEPDLREVFLGEWEGGELRRRVIDQDPLAAAMFEAGRWDIIPGAEPDDDFRSRVQRGIERIAAAHPDEVVVVGRPWRRDRPGDEHRRRVDRVRASPARTTHRSRTWSSRRSAGSSAASTTRRISATGSAPPTSHRRRPASAPPASRSEPRWIAYGGAMRWLVGGQVYDAEHADFRRADIGLDGDRITQHRHRTRPRTTTTCSISRVPGCCPG